MPVKGKKEGKSTKGETLLREVPDATLGNHPLRVGKKKIRRGNIQKGLLPEEKDN